MDFSSEYTKQCEKAVEIQGVWKPCCGDYLLLRHPKDRRVVILQNGGEDLRVNFTKHQGFTVLFPSSYGDNTDLKFADDVIWLPRQDQLQMIVIGDKGLQTVCNMIYQWAISSEGCKYTTQGGSMEQLWLSFVMKEKYDKVWDGDEWI